MHETGSEEGTLGRLRLLPPEGCRAEALPGWSSHLRLPKSALPLEDMGPAPALLPQLLPSTWSWLGPTHHMRISRQLQTCRQGSLL